MGRRPTSSEVFPLHTGVTNGRFQIPDYPLARIEKWRFTNSLGAFDRHLLSITPRTATFQEEYDISLARHTKSTMALPARF